jgi:hypothetical protein
MGDPISRSDRVGENGATFLQMLVVVAAPEVDGVVGSEVRAQAVNVADLREMEPDGGRQVLSRQASESRGVAGVAEIGVAVDVHQAEPAPTAQPECGTQQDAAVAAQDQHALGGVKALTDSPAKTARVVDQRGLVPDSTRGDVGQIATRDDHTCLASAHGAKTFMQPCLA